MNKRTRRILIGLLAALTLGIGCIGWSYADDPYADDPYVGGNYTVKIGGVVLQPHTESHENGYSHDVDQDIDEEHDCSWIEAYCLWEGQDGETKLGCWYHFMPRINLYAHDAEYDGKSHGGSMTWE